MKRKVVKNINKSKTSNHTGYYLYLIRHEVDIVYIGVTENIKRIVSNESIKNSKYIPELTKGNSWNNIEVINLECIIGHRRELFYAKQIMLETYSSLLNIDLYDIQHIDEISKARIYKYIIKIANWDRYYINHKKVS